MTPSRQHVRDLYDDYATCLDDGDLDGWVDLFTDDAQYLVVARENWARGLPLATLRCDGRGMLVDRALTVRTTQFYAPRVMRHFVTGVRIGGADSGLACTANFLVTEAIEMEPARIHLTGQYRDTVVATPDGLRFARKVAIYDGALVETSLIVPV
jgi:3-phenylpropionate/cinnamic acid dioxygenase small subunit